ncbi:hypothetical protein EGW08_019992 [Elysia chlorotica]|uniref:Glycine N-acyltransferase-like protein n=1 Tax=Elysia chlorotica TaxID=188477 RepID=A0A3S1AZH1_ELYCH|nr:hypothetical protein EGW08_019992 [Elysia chlorotica]
MEETLHVVKECELPALKDWLEKFLPDSFRCYLYYSEPRTTSVFSPEPPNLEKLLLWPGFLDWSQPIIFQGVSSRLTHSISKMAASQGGNCRIYHYVLYKATQSEIPLRPIPEGFRIDALDPDLHTDYILSTWSHVRKNTDVYVREALRRLPSVGLFDKDGQCIGVEAGTDYGSIGMLHVQEAFRGRGLGKVITSQLAHKYFCDGLPVIALAGKDNESSLRMHTSCGFKEVGFADWLFYNVGDEREFDEKVGYKGP